MALLALPAFCRISPPSTRSQFSSTAFLAVACQAKLTNKDAVLDLVQGLCKPVCFHPSCAHKLHKIYPFPTSWLIYLYRMSIYRVRVV